MLVVINKCYGGFDLSDKAVRKLALRKGWKLKKDGWGDWLMVFPDGSESWWSPIMIDRRDSDLIEVVRELGDEANGGDSELEIVEIPDGIEWRIEDNDGAEKIVKKGD